eukprot:TRINITY_DN939_c0_g1_i1.p1 TRINITY_DN939_c0_g1~~TRINITY_DN939_c0_g1_i1.p1  ORF type:complete len:1336 (-),score=295.30 TRINITY_DN939_c0_g1_i1:21-4028(-)
MDRRGGVAVGESIFSPPTHTQSAVTFIPTGDKKYAVLFGGMGGPGTVFVWSELYVYDIGDCQWILGASTSTIAQQFPPPIRCGHSINFVPNSEPELNRIETTSNISINARRIQTLKSEAFSYIQNGAELIHNKNERLIYEPELELLNNEPAPFNLHPQINNGFLILYGGKGINDKCEPDVWVFSFKLFCWLRVPFIEEDAAASIKKKKSFPTPRHFHSSIFLPSQNKIFIFGGRTSEGKALSDSWYLYIGMIPTTFEEASFSQTNKNLDFWRGWKWEKMTSKVKKPSARHSHFCGVLPELQWSGGGGGGGSSSSNSSSRRAESILIYGGIGNMSKLDDIFIFDTEANKWSKIKADLKQMAQGVLAGYDRYSGSEILYDTDYYKSSVEQNYEGVPRNAKTAVQSYCLFALNKYLIDIQNGGLINIIELADLRKKKRYKTYDQHLVKLSGTGVELMRKAYELNIVTVHPNKHILFVVNVKNNKKFKGKGYNTGMNALILTMRDPNDPYKIDIDLIDTYLSGIPNSMPFTTVRKLLLELRWGGQVVNYWVDEESVPGITIDEIKGTVVSKFRGLTKNKNKSKKTGGVAGAGNDLDGLAVALMAFYILGENVGEAAFIGWINISTDKALQKFLSYHVINYDANSVNYGYGSGDLNRVASHSPRTTHVPTSRKFNSGAMSYNVNSSYNSISQHEERQLRNNNNKIIMFVCVADEKVTKSRYNLTSSHIALPDLNGRYLSSRRSHFESFGSEGERYGGDRYGEERPMLYRSRVTSGVIRKLQRKMKMFENYGFVYAMCSHHSDYRSDFKKKNNKWLYDPNRNLANRGRGADTNLEDSPNVAGTHSRHSVPFISSFAEESNKDRGISLGEDDDLNRLVEQAVWKDGGGGGGIFSWRLLVWEFLKFLLLPLTTIHLLLFKPRFNFSIGSFLVMLLVNLTWMTVIVSPAMLYTFVPELGISDIPYAFTPFVLCSFFALITSTIEASLVQDGGADRDAEENLVKFRVKVKQRMINGSIGVRETHAEELIQTIMEREQLTKDRNFYFFRCLIGSLIIASGHFSVAILYYFLKHHDFLHLSGTFDIWQGFKYSSIALNVVLNFWVPFAFCFALGVGLAVYERHLRYLRFFGLLTDSVEVSVVKNFLPYLNLRTSDPNSVFAWMEMRSFLLHTAKNLPILSSNVILGWAFLLNFCLWVFIAVLVFASPNHLFSPVNLLIVYDATVLSVFLAFAVVRINRIAGYQSVHAGLLTMVQFDLTWSIMSQKNKAKKKGVEDDKQKREAEDKARMVGMLNLLTRIIEKHSSESVRLFGLKLGRGVVGLIFGITVSLTLATATRALIDSKGLIFG